MERELRVRSRQWRTWSWRSGLVAAGCMAWVVPVMLGSLSSTSGKPALGVISIFPFVFAMLSGALLTADCISREKRDGTLGLLFLTALKPGEIIRQKMFAAGANSLLSLVAITPLFVLPVVLGGVTGTEVATLMLLLVVTFFWSCSIGCLVSVLTFSAPAAMVLAFCAALAPAALALGLEVWLPEALLWRALAQSFDPVQVYTQVAFGFRAIGGMTNLVMGVLVLSGVLCLTVAGRLLPSCLVKIRSERKQTAGSMIRRILALQNLMANRIAVAAGGAAALLIIAGATMQGSPQARLVLVALLNLGIKLLIAVQAARIFHCRPWLEAVLTTPLPVEEYVGQQFKWFVNRFFPVLAATFVVDLLLAQVPFFGPAGRMTLFQNATVVSLLFLVPDAIVLCLLGFWYGVINRTINEAAGNVISRVIFLPLAAAVFFTAMGLRTATAVGALTLWSVMCLGIDVLLGAWAVWLLKNRLRYAVSEK